MRKPVPLREMGFSYVGSAGWLSSFEKQKNTDAYELSVALFCVRERNLGQFRSIFGVMELSLPVTAQ